MRSLSGALVVAALVIFMGAQPATAKGPSREPLIQDPVTFAADEVCSFRVKLENVRGGQTQTSYANGVIRYTGAVWTRVTNLKTGRSITVNAGGPIVIRPNSDGTVTVKGSGRTLFFFFSGNLGEGRDGALLLMTGLVVETLNADYTELLSFEHSSGTTEDLCQTLR
jgi:hypothetical protein